MKKLLTISLALLCLATLVWAQVWTYDSDFKTNLKSPHGVVVDPDGKIWICTYYHSPAYYDTIVTAAGTKMGIKPLLVYNADGTAASFSPLWVVDDNGTLDTLSNAARGLSKDKDGNILYSAYDELFRINYQTGALMGKVVPKSSTSLTEAACTDDGYIIIGHVASGNPWYVFDEDLDLYLTAEDVNTGLQRSICVSGDGNDVYMGKIYSGYNGVVHYHSEAGVDGPYTRVDTVGSVPTDTNSTKAKYGMIAQCLDWDPNGLLWVGTYWDGTAGSQTLEAFDGWYALDPSQGFAIVDTIGHSYGAYSTGATVGGGGFYSPRGIDWTADGHTAYIADFDGGVIMKFTNASPKGKGSAILDPVTDLGMTSKITEEGNKVIVADFRLLPNFPNPFNPTTNIPFEIQSERNVKLTVYDMLGREIATLLNDKVQAGRHTYQFDASGYASGMYIYRLEVDGQQISKSMIYVK